METLGLRMTSGKMRIQPSIIPVACKMATGSGKAVVMAMYRLAP
jgi:hypothetical protein